MARESLSLLAIMFAASGCVVADPPEYQPPAQTPPMLDLFLADPPVRQVLAKDLGETISFNIPVRSEDAGEGLLGALFVDFGFSTERLHRFVSEDPSTLDDKTRSLEFSWTVAGVSKGCHLLSLLVTHRENFEEESLRPIDSSDQDMVTWWFNVDPDETDPNSLDNCPTVSEPGM